MAKRVWILGAGFSAGLGGPLLADLMSMRSWQGLRASWPYMFDTSQPNPQRLAYHLYHFGMGYPEGYCIHQFRPGEEHRGEKFFRDAEDYLTWLDSADSMAYSNLRERWGMAREQMDTRFPAEGDSIEPVRRAAKRIIAAECELFLRRAPESTLGPYKRWAAKLTPEDSVITFNYDRVVETMRPGTVDVVGVGAESRPDYPSLFKMHGSVDWVEKNNEVTRITGDKAVEAAVLSLDYDPVIGMPGRSKDAQIEGLLKAVWVKAGEALRNAECIHIIGYRIPESDSLSRSWLLSNLGRNSNHLKVTLTLGQPGFHTDRLESLLSMGTFGRLNVATSSMAMLEPKVLSMWAQEHLDAFAHGRHPLLSG